MAKPPAGRLPPPSTLLATGSPRLHASASCYDHTLSAFATDFDCSAGSGSAVSIGTKALFAGGVSGLTAYDRVDIYDVQTDTWSTAQLSAGRFMMGATTIGTKAIFAGGGTVTNNLAAVDIYESTTGQWSTAQLSVARTFVTGCSVGRYAIFAGGAAGKVLFSLLLLCFCVCD